jgi:hypothetical protein
MKRDFTSTVKFEQCGFQDKAVAKPLFKIYLYFLRNSTFETVSILEFV